jgi:hypothetical protein
VRGNGRRERTDPGLGGPGLADPWLSAPQWSDPGHDRSAFPDPGFGTPQYGDPGYGPGQYGDSGYGPAAYSQPGYGAPQYADPWSAEPQYGDPGYGPAPYGDPGLGGVAAASAGAATGVLVSPAHQERAPRPAARPAPERQPARPAPRPRAARKPRRRVSTRMLALAGASTVLAGAAAIILTRPDGGGVAHVLTTPGQLGAYVQEPRLAQKMDAQALQQQIVKQADGHVKNVIYAVYEDAKAGPQIFLFMGGNLSGSSPGDFIATFSGKFPGATTTSAGALGGQATCVPSTDGQPAACLWADNDTFGVLTSATLSAPDLGDEMRQMRPMVEHEVGKSH